MRTGRYRWVPASVLAAVVTLSVVAVAFVPFVPEQLRIGAYRATPPLRVLALLGVYFAAAWWTRHRVSRRPAHLLLAGILFAMHMSVEVQPLGDYTIWCTWLHLDHAGSSELLANVVHRCVYAQFGTAGTNCVAPIAGLLFSLAFLSFVESTCGGRGVDAARARLVGAAVLALSGWQLLFCRGYLENTQLSLPFLVRAMAAMVAIARGRADLGAVVRCSAWLSLACLFHGMNVPVLIALVLVLVWRARRRPNWQLGRDLGVVVAVVAGLIWLAVQGLRVAGFAVQAGHVQGGGDGRHFVPLVLAGLPHWYEFAMFDAAHLADVGNLYLQAAPALVGGVALLGSSRVRTDLLRAIGRQPALAIAGLGSASLTSIYYFDLMFPLDYDLMLGMCVPLTLFALQCALVVRGVAARWIDAALVLGGVHAWAIMGALLVAPAGPIDAGAASAPTAELAVNRRTGEVHCRAGEWLFIEVLPAASIAAPYRLQLFAWTGDLPDTVPPAAAELGLRFPRPEDAAAPGRSVLIADKVQGGDADGPFRGDAHFVSSALPCGTVVDTTTIQALLTDLQGRTFATNSVRIVP
ncbi:MAG: hypothetical protein JNM25_14210 [Planctomycetes bacterium]|nr:hypothetical protein [Planctomycetota bacterium]